MVNRVGLISFDRVRIPLFELEKNKVLFKYNLSQNELSLKNLFYYLFIYFWLRWVFVAMHGLSPVVVSGGYSSLWCAGFSLQWFHLLQSMGSRRTGFSSCGTWAH